MAVLVVIAWLVVSGFSRIVDGRGADAARCGGARRSRRRHAAAGQGRQSERARAGWNDRDHVCGVERRSRAGARAHQGRRQRQAEESVRHVGDHRGGHRRLGARHRRAAQGRRRSQYPESGRGDAADGGGAQRQRRRGAAAARGACRHQRQGKLRRSVGADVGGRAEPGGDGEAPGLEGRRPERARRRPPVGAQGHQRAASEGHEQGRLYAADLRGPRRLRRRVPGT